MKKLIWIAVTAATISGIAAVGAYAHGGATGIVKERMEHMKTMGQSMKELTAMMRGKSEYDAMKVRELATTIAEHGGKKMLEKFPKGSNPPPSEALPSIWSDWDRFAMLSEKVTTYANALAAAAENERPHNQGGMMNGSGGMMQGNQGMMGQSGGMMQEKQGKMKGSGGMMGKDESGPSPEHLSKMPPDAAFMHLARACSDCHQDFRLEK